MIQKRERTDLYDKFRQGAIPSGADFADLIRSQLNLLDDGIDVSEDPKEPVCLRAHGENDNFLDLATSGGTKKWRISGRCEDKSREGFNITAGNLNRLYIERETGNVGINTDKPTAKLHVIQNSAIDALRVDDEGTDQTPFVIDSLGRAGLGTGNPIAKLHINYAGSGDILRVDDQDGDSTPLIIDETGNIGIGFAESKTKLAVNGGVSIGTADFHGENNLYVAGDFEVNGSVIFSGDQGIQFNAPLTSGTQELVIMDNLKVMGDPHQKGSDGNLKVAGDTTLGTYNKIYEKQNVISVNGRIRSGGDSDSGDEQYELEVNEVLTVSRKPSSLQATVKGNLSVTGTNTLGNNQGNDYIYLNGTVQREGDEAVTIDDSLTVTKNAAIKSAAIESLQLATGATVNEISTDTGFSDNSNLAIPTERAVKEYIDNLLAGSISAFAIGTPPVGWLECNGQAVSRSDFSRLFGLVGTRFGTGNGATTFNLPDLRDEFIRGWNHTRNLGNRQEAAFQNHVHDFYGTYSSVYSNGHDHWDGTANTIWTLVKRAHEFFKDKWNWEYNANGRTGWDYHDHNFVPRGTISGATTGNVASETRPQNTALMFCIKY
jgi:hypothetical protein